MRIDIFIFLVILSLVKAASKYYDGPIRPYEFGYQIEGNQHRHESKDKDGLIMGEFGFITADNVYHVTVYATDADGNFKVISMKNYKLGPKTTTTTTTTTTTPPPTTTTSTTPQPFKIITTTAKSIFPLTTLKPSSQVACGGCKIPELTPAPPATSSAQPETTTQYVPPFKVVNRDENDGEPDATTKPANSLDPTTTNSPALPQKLVQLKPNSIEKQQAEKIKTDKTPNSMQPAKQTQFPNLNKPLQTSKPTSTAFNIDKMNSINTVNTVQHILNGLLYKFNYTAGYHGHHEKGDRQGNKEGGYFAVGRDGVKRIVDYKANEFGYQPYIKFEKLQPEDTPREETEKEAGLKGFDFKWFWGS